MNASSTATAPAPVPVPAEHAPPKPETEDRCVPTIAVHADRLVELFEAESRRIQAIYDERLRKTEELLMANLDGELSFLRQTVLQQRTLLEQMSGGVEQPPPVSANNADAMEHCAEGISAAEELSRVKQAIEAVGFVYVDGSIRFTPRSAHSTEFIVGLFSSAVEHCRQSGIQSEHLTRSEELISGPIKPTDLWEVLELMALLPRLHDAAEGERAEAVAAAAAPSES